MYSYGPTDVGFTRSDSSWSSVARCYCMQIISCPGESAEGLLVDAEVDGVGKMRIVGQVQAVQ